MAWWYIPVIPALNRDHELEASLSYSETLSQKSNTRKEGRREGGREGDCPHSIKEGPRHKVTSLRTEVLRCSQGARTCFIVGQILQLNSWHWDFMLHHEAICMTSYDLGSVTNQLVQEHVSSTSHRSNIGIQKWINMGFASLWLQKKKKENSQAGWWQQV
jgi:hypothetical protein